MDLLQNVFDSWLYINQNIFFWHLFIYCVMFIYIFWNGLKE